MLPWLIQWDKTLDGWNQRGSDINDILKSSLSCHTNCLLCRLSICHFVNGSLLTPAFFNGSDKGGATCKSCNFNHWATMQELQCTILSYYAAGLSRHFFYLLLTFRDTRSDRCDLSQAAQSSWYGQLHNDPSRHAKFGGYSRCSRLSERDWTTLNKESKERFDKRWFLADLHQLEAALSNDISISSAIWQALLVSDSLGNSACAKGGHRHNFKHQRCCPGYQRRWNPPSHTTEIVCFARAGFVIWSMAHFSSSSLLQWFQQTWCHMQVLQFRILARPSQAMLDVIRLTT